MVETADMAPERRGGDGGGDDVVDEAGADCVEEMGQERMCTWVR